MNKKKKNVNKENCKNNKITPLVTIPSFNTTQQIRIPTLTSHQLKNMVKSIELKKTFLNNPYKKSQLRKSANKIVRVHTVNYPTKVKSIMLSSKQLKNIHQRSQSNSKSPISRKSKSSKKYLMKKSVGFFQANPASKTNIKIKKTIKQLEENTLKINEDSFLPIKTTSDMIINEQFNENMIFPLTQDCIDIDQLRKYCQIKTGKGTIQLSHKRFDNFKENRAALKIQRAWKRYRTKRLVSRYVFLSHFQEDKDFPRRQIIQINDQRSLNYEQFSPYQKQNAKKETIIIPSLQISRIYPKEVESLNLQHKRQYLNTINRIKMEQLQKWNEIIQMISLNRSKNPQELQVMLQKLTEQSKANKQKLQSNTNIIIQRGKQLKSKIKQLKYQSVLYEKSNSFQQFNSQKYIEFLDSDLYFKDNQKSISFNQSQKITISKKKQQILLQSLTTKIGEQSINKCESMKTLQINPYLPKRSLKSSLKKSNSQKLLKDAMSSMKNKNLQQLDEPSQINLQLLAKQFLQGSSFCTQNFDIFYSEQKLKSKLAELNKMKQQGSQQSSQRQEEVTFRSSSEDQIACEDNYLTSMNDINEDQPQLRRSNQFLLHIPKDNGEIKIIQEKYQSLQSIPYCQDDGKVDACCALVQNALLIELFQDIAKFNTILKALSNSFIVSEPNTVKKKKGFATSKAEIYKFLQDILSYLHNNQPTVYKNLQVSTGPSALEMLRYMHQYNQDAPPQENTDDGDDANVMVIPNRIFDEIWHIKQQSIVANVPKQLQQQNGSIIKYQFDVLKNLNKIFYRSMFDTFNECLDCQRNFGLYGKPFPWKRSPSFYHQKSQKTLNEQVQKARKKMMELSITYCGLIIEKQEMVNQINEEYIKQVHQDRLSRMLATDLLESQERWIFYDDQQTEILVEVSNMVYLMVLKEVVLEIESI